MDWVSGRERETRVEKECGWVVDLMQVISDREGERNSSLEVIWLTGWDFKSERREWVGERLKLGSILVVEWLSLSSTKWYSNFLLTFIWLSGWSHTNDIIQSEWERDYSWERMWLNGWSHKSDIRQSEGEGNLSLEMMWLTGWDFKKERRES